MDALTGPSRPEGAGDYQPPRKRASDPNKDSDPVQPVPMADQVAAVQRWQMDRNGKPLRDDEPARKLAHGLDTVYVTFEVDWKHGEEGGDPELWRIIEEAQVKAKGEHADQVGTKDEGVWCDTGTLVVLPCLTGYGDLYVNVMPSGTAKGGYRWLLRGRGFVIKLARSKVCKSRPNVMLELGSEVCWRHGSREFIEFFRRFLKLHGGEVQVCKPSRVDMCVDLLVPDDTIERDSDRYIVSRCRKYTPYAEIRKPVHGIALGEGGDLSLRIYNKPKEITDKGGAKSWFYDLWCIRPGDVNRIVRRTRTGKPVHERMDCNVPEGDKVFRVEFELKREALKALNANTIEDLFEQAPAIWQYLTGDWCRFVERPEVKRDRQEVLPWWRVVQDAWPQAWEGPSAVRAVRPGRDAELLARGALGYLTSLVAADAAEGGGPAELEAVDIDRAMSILKRHVAVIRGQNQDLTLDVIGKTCKYDKGLVKFDRASVLRRSMRIESEPVYQAIHDGQDERTIRVEDGSSRLAAGFWDRVRAAAVAESASKPKEQKREIIAAPVLSEIEQTPESEQLQKGFGKILEQSKEWFS